MMLLWLYLSKTSADTEQAGLEEGSFEVYGLLWGGYQGLGFFYSNCHK